MTEAGRQGSHTSQQKATASTEKETIRAAPATATATAASFCSANCKVKKVPEVCTGDVPPATCCISVRGRSTSAAAQSSNGKMCHVGQEQTRTSYLRRTTGGSNSSNSNSGSGKAVQGAYTTGRSVSRICLKVVAMPAAGLPAVHWDLLLAFCAYSSGLDEFSLAKIVLQTSCFYLFSLEIQTGCFIHFLFRLGPLLTCSGFVHRALRLLFSSSSS